MQKDKMKNLWIYKEDWQTLVIRKVKDGKSTLADVISDILKSAKNE